MATVRILLCLLYLAFAGRSRLFGSSTVEKESDALIAIAQSQVGVKEAKGNNDGVEVEAYLAVAGLKKGEPWCAAFLSWVFKQAGYHQPRTGWSPALFPEDRKVKTPSPGLVFGIYFPTLKRISHCGIVERVKGSWVTGIEGNTNLNGSRDGDGVYRKLRHVKTIYCYANWMNNHQKKGPAK
ncbi:CHAP domain-containing protein [Pedobacter hiemivivus]|uniref:CHAP domain-containing protein n=1 Tax=Pedobacter hiemivivus TaxID=2530454 RepID=A0A4R0NDC6_9SPHI|nr:CHAP domain-containing protein [Pedobacter hiemivivus]TCC97243.1 CHAP domain-containing protein [Pedobacter hiemivivus]